MAIRDAAPCEAVCDPHNNACIYAYYIILCVAQSDALWRRTSLGRYVRELNTAGTTTGLNTNPKLVTTVYTLEVPLTPATPAETQAVQYNDALNADGK